MADQPRSGANPSKSSMSSITSPSTLVEKTEQKAKQALTVLFSDLPLWLRDNQFILSGYRPPSNSYFSSISSLAYVHNESVNIWTHLLGALASLAGGIFFYTQLKPRFDLATVQDVWAFACFFLGAIVCLGMSATFHTISNHSEAVAKFGNRLDYMGIVALIWGSFVPSIFYGFSRSEPGLVRVYWTMISSIAAGTLAVVMLPKFRTPEWRSFRAFMFCAMGLSAVVPVIHGLRLHGLEQMERQMGLSWLVLQGVLYVTGAVIYAARVPERWMPGSFDIWGSSHQIFHVLVVLAAVVHLKGLVNAFDYEHSFRGTLIGAYDSARSLGKHVL